MTSNRVLYLGDAAAMDANDMVGFSPTEISDLMMALDRAIKDGMPTAKALRRKIQHAREKHQTSTTP